MTQPVLQHAAAQRGVRLLVHPARVGRCGPCRVQGKHGPCRGRGRCGQRRVGVCWGQPRRQCRWSTGTPTMLCRVDGRGHGRGHWRRRRQGRRAADLAPGVVGRRRRWCCGRRPTLRRGRSDHDLRQELRRRWRSLWIGGLMWRRTQMTRIPTSWVSTMASKGVVSIDPVPDSVEISLYIKDACGLHRPSCLIGHTNTVFFVHARVIHSSSHVTYALPFVQKRGTS
mmetsp:Transcript_53449/g.125711  ORF Transcript_53449/g.125711 Transcript_53449/m.125711 type:complete len:226 (+) Transcript_53449:1807-2484(+)